MCFEICKYAARNSGSKDRNLDCVCDVSAKKILIPSSLSVCTQSAVTPTHMSRSHVMKELNYCVSFNPKQLPRHP